MAHFLTLVVVFLFCVASSYAVNVVDVQAICKEAKDPSFCLTLLKSKPGGVGQDLNSLAQYTIDVLHTNVSNTVTLITKLIAQSGSDRNKQDHYKNCYSHFLLDGGALGEVVNAQQQLKAFDYYNVYTHMNAIATDVYDCLTGDESVHQDARVLSLYKDTSLLPKYVDVVGQIALIITNMVLILQK
ncbi:putative pectinesterase inhibitor domain-containing protein [Medicago truncatula]|uniref:Plant invertase/pectin methylesterase inhibitor n=1 Tax=Medicago truncatula TaxID=3880 RepID=A0A072UI41_MEDTR|nr:pectinesterase inhibitor 2 [Medicago truncatula]KEH25470.1 plant invertase/pectin methylesterase inhibitor [Medicago truncatula]RHN50642.1 putative pectinesterase inhibitor domain-containing protein [Medicago truncatula]